MKFFLLKLVTLSLLHTSGVCAIDENQALRGSLESNAAGINSDNPCEDGMSEAKRKLNQIWEEYSKDCNEFHNLEVDANWEIIDRMFHDGPRTTPWDQTKNRCARDAVKKELTRIEKECTSALCRSLGKTAAEEIVLSDYCPRHKSSRRVTGCRRNWKRACKKHAQIICEDEIYSAGERKCGHSQNMNQNERQELQKKCVRKVDEMVLRDPQFDLCPPRGGNGGPYDPDVIFDDSDEPGREGGDMERVASVI